MMSTDETGLFYRGNHGGNHPEILRYQVVDCSSYSAGYRPENILEDKPSDQASRWSSASNDQNQYILIKLEKLSIINTISFGKFHKNHVCNLREFKVLVNTGEGDGWVEVLHSGLRNDNETETFPLVFSNGKVIPVLFLKIIPLAAWGNSFNYSIWFVELRGNSNEQVIEEALQKYNEEVKTESWRICLKFLREQQGMEDIFDLIKSRLINIKLDDILVNNLFKEIVKEGNFANAEAILSLENEQNPNLFNEYLEDDSLYQPVWTRLDRRPSSDGNFPTPRMRGGHQMGWDPVDKQIYLLGGWDGHQDLGDFWRYNITSNTWECLSEDTRLEGGPGPRSCHKIVLHSIRRKLFVLGKYVDNESRATNPLLSDFYSYDLVNHTWTCIDEDVQRNAGPSLVYDHQMAIDEDRDTIYVFGGRLIQQTLASNSLTSPLETQYSGLFSYDIANDKWKMIRADNELIPGTPNIKSRIGHSMVFDPNSRLLYIYAGQRNKDYLCDFYAYDVDKDEVVEVVKDTSKVGGPEAGFTQRSTIDIERQELFLFSGLMKDKTSTVSFTSNTSPSPISSSAQQTTTTSTSTTENAKNCFWIYNVKNRKWTRIYSTESYQADSREPCPRFAHQLVYDSSERVHYLFGGNPGEPGNPRKRLDDFWMLELRQPRSCQDVLRKGYFLIRRQQFYEMCLARRTPIEVSNAASPTLVNAMRFLQTDLAQAVNHENPQESKEFRNLTSWLICPPNKSISIELTIRKSRLKLFNDLVSLLPKHMRPPPTNISDLVLGQIITF